MIIGNFFSAPVRRPSSSQPAIAARPSVTESPSRGDGYVPNQATSEMASPQLSQLPSQDAGRLLQLTDPELIQGLSLEEAEKNLAVAAEIFARNEDRRGIFPSAYAEITAKSLDFVAELEQQNPEQAHKARTLATDFAQRYFQGLGNHLRGHEDKTWSDYYRMAQNPKSDPIQVFLTGANAHLVGDLPKSLVAGGMRGYADKRLYMQWGQTLSDSTPAMVDRLKSDHKVDARSFLVSSCLRAKAFQAFRTPAWICAQRYHHDCQRSGVDPQQNLHSVSEGYRDGVGKLLFAAQPLVWFGDRLGETGMQIERDLARTLQALREGKTP